MIQPHLSLVPTNPPAPENKPSEDDKKTVAAYVASLKLRGFCKIDDASSNQTRLINRISRKILPMSFITNDFNRWLHSRGKKCYAYSPSYIIYTLEHVIGSIFKPIDSPYIREAITDCNYINTYQKYRPKTTSDDVSPLFLEYLERLVPDEAERHIFCQWLAHIFQHPEERPSWHVMLTSEPGTGKGFLMQEILRPLLLHTSVVASYSKVMGQFSSVLEDNLLVLLDDPKSKSDDTQTQLKSILSEERAYCERKHLQGGMVNTYTRFILASNETRPLHFEPTERRWWSPARLVHKEGKDGAEETQAFIQTLANWLAEHGSLCRVYNYFMEFDLTGFNPKHIAQSENMRSMIGMSGNIHFEFLTEFAAEHKVFTHAELMKAYDDAEIRRPPDKQISHLLREADFESTRPRIDGKLKSIYHPIGMSADTIRAALKEAPTGF